MVCEPAMSERGERLVVRVDPDLRALIPTYLANRRQDIAEVGAALARDDWETIRRIGHRMRGSGAGYGFDGLTDRGRALEDAAQAQDAEAIRACVRDVTGYLDRVEVI
jgi:HPt (histidine-containing phosphotransfer) domain-containing protein